MPLPYPSVSSSAMGSRGGMSSLGSARSTIRFGFYRHPHLLALREESARPRRAKSRGRNGRGRPGALSWCNCKPRMVPGVC